MNAGLFSVLDNENTLAAVMFHEAAHGLARMLIATTAIFVIALLITLIL